MGERTDTPEALGGEPMSRMIREVVSAGMMCLPLAAGIVAAWTVLPTAPPTLDVHVDRNGVVDGTAPTWLMVAVPLALSVVAAVLGIAGLRESWQANRRVQRALAGGAAVLGLVVLLWSVEFTRLAGTGADLVALPVVLSVFGAIFWGVLCLVVTPPDLLAD